MNKAKELHPIEAHEQPICEAIYALILQLALRIVRNRELLGDVIQITILRVLQNLEVFLEMPEVERSRYLSIAIRQNWWQVEQWTTRSLRLDQEKWQDIHADPLCYHSSALVAVSQALAKALEEPTAYERTAYLLREVEHWSYPQIATHLGTTVAAVRKAVSEAKSKIETFLIKQGYPLERF